MMPTDCYILEARATGCIAEVLLNGFRLTTLGPDLPDESLPVNQFVITGSNELSMRIRPIPPPPTDAKGSHVLAFIDPASASARLRIYPPGVFPGDPSGRSLTETVWEVKRLPADQVDADSARRGYLRVVSQAEAGVAFGRWKWQDAAPVTPGARQFDEAFALIARLRSALTQGDPAPFINAAAVRFEELARAYGVNADEQRTAFADQLRSFASGANWALRPLASNASISILENIRVIECADAAGEPWLAAMPNADGFPGPRWPAFLAKLDGRWQIVR